MNINIKPTCYGKVQQIKYFDYYISNICSPSGTWMEYLYK